MREGKCGTSFLLEENKLILEKREGCVCLSPRLKSSCAAVKGTVGAGSGKTPVSPVRVFSSMHRSPVSLNGMACPLNGQYCLVQGQRF